MTTKKMLVPFDIDNPNKIINDFLYPTKSEGKYIFKGVKSGKVWRNGMISFIGKPITGNDIFARIVDSKIKIENVKSMLKTLECYIEQIKSLPLGTIYEIEDLNETFQIKFVSKRPKIKKDYRLP